MKAETSARLRACVPNALTLCNSLCGFAAIIYTLRAYEYSYNNSGDPMGVFVISAIMIFSAMIFDACDGFAARMLKATSMAGIQMDSLADMVTFGVAPATIVAIMTHSMRDWELKWVQELGVYLLCSVYLGCAALRLAIYNVQAIQPEKRKSRRGWFSGLPSPGAAAAICVLVFYAYHTSYDLYRLAFILPIYAGVLGLLMVSNVPYLHVGEWLVSMIHNRRKIGFFVLLLVLVAIFRINGLVFIVTAYILSGPVGMVTSLLIRPRKRDRETE